MTAGPAPTRYARRLFACAAAFNLLVALSGLFLFSLIAPLLGLVAAAGEVAYWRDLFFVLVLAFGVAYALVAVDAARFRAYVPLGVIGKSLVVVAGLAAWARGDVGPLAVAPLLGDVLFVVLFIDFLRRSGKDSAQR